jgi:hypothetical protein
VNDLTLPPAEPGAAHDAGDARVERLDSLYYGKYRGVVVDNADPDQLGRLRLMVPSLFGGSANPQPSDPFVTDWAWPCVPFGGTAEQGFFFVPEVGAKVWVEFEEGDLDCPLWVGCFWSKPSASEVPEEAKAMQENKPHKRVLKTPSGHLIEFDDTPGEEGITVRHKSNAFLHFDAKGSVTVGNAAGTFLFLNAEDKEFSFADENGNNVRLGDSNVTLTNADGSVLDLNGPAVQVIAKNVMLRSETVALGEGALEPAILGRAFAAVFDTHVHPTALGPSGPPLPVPMPLSAPTHPAMSKAVTLR